jgi:hypothetical protein
LAAAAPLGMPSGKVGHHPGWKPLQGSANDHVPGWVGSKPVPAPRTRYEVRASLRRVLTAATATSTPFRAPVRVCGEGVPGQSGVLGFKKDYDAGLNVFLKRACTPPGKRSGLITQGKIVIGLTIKERGRRKRKEKLQLPGIEPGSPAWQASIIPLDHSCSVMTHTANHGYL